MTDHSPPTKTPAAVRARRRGCSATTPTSMATAADRDVAHAGRPRHATLNPDGTFIYTPAAELQRAGQLHVPRVRRIAVLQCSDGQHHRRRGQRSARREPGFGFDEQERAGHRCGPVQRHRCRERHALRVASVTQGANGTVAINPDKTVTYTPASNYVGTDSFTYVVSDGNGGQDTGTVSVTVNAVANVAPVAVADGPYSTNEDSALTVTAPGVLANDTDPDGPSALTAVLVTGSTHGGAALNANGGFTYTPAANYNGPDSFTYRAYDGADYSSTGDRLAHRHPGQRPAGRRRLTPRPPPRTARATIAVLGQRHRRRRRHPAVTAVDARRRTAPRSSTPTGPSPTRRPPTTTARTRSPTPSPTATAAPTPPRSTSPSPRSTTRRSPSTTPRPPPRTARAHDRRARQRHRRRRRHPDGHLGRARRRTAPPLINPGKTVTYTPAANYNGADSFTYTVSDGNGGTDTATVNVTVDPGQRPAGRRRLTPPPPPRTARPRSRVLANDTDVDGDTLSVTSVDARRRTAPRPSTPTRPSPTRRPPTTTARTRSPTPSPTATAAPTPQRSTSR